MSSFNMKNLTNALAKTAGVIEKTVKTTVQDVTGPKPLQEFELLNQIGSAGPGLAWKLFSARSGRDSTRLQHRHYPVVCVWVLDKRALSEARTRAGLSKAAEDSFLDLIRADATRLVRIRHPGVLHVVQALDESKNAMAMVTEPLFASVANALGNLENVPEVPKELKGVEMGLLEVKHGLLQIAETLDFVHNNAHLIHRAIAPENILITSSGAWKLGGFSFAITVDKYVSNFTNVQAFHYAEYDAEDSLLPLQPSLNYTAPELTRNEGSSVGCSSDIFSFGCLAYQLIARKPLFDCHNNLKMYTNKLQYLSSEAFSSIPHELVSDLRRMLSANESTRPTAIDFTASPFFRDDTRLRALRFLDHMLGRDNMQKSEFLKALADMWKDFDSRVLRYKVLGPLCAELRNVVMQPMILPMVLTIAESQDKNDFELSTLPALLPVLGTASGETLLLLVKKADLLINKTSVDNLVSDVLPMLVRAYDDSDARIQEEVLKKSASLAKQLDSQLVKQVILPRVHGLALKTTVAAVRVNALLCFSELIHTLDRQGVLIVLQTIHRCTAVDRSAPTLMCTLGIANSILKQFGIEFSAEHVLPLVTPLLNAPQLNNQQFTKYMLFVKDVLRKMEEKRGVVVTDSGIPEVKASDAIQCLELNNKSGGNVAASTKSSPSWDEDWVTTSKGPTTSVEPSKTTDVSSPLSSISVPVVPINQPTQVTSSMLPPSFPSSSQQASPTCTPVDIEWPPRAPPSGSPRLDNNEKQTTNHDSSFDDIDPFATWPPQPPGPGTSSNGTSGSSVNNYGFNSVSSSVNSTNFQANSDSWAFNTQGSLNELGQYHGGSAINTGTFSSGDLDSQDPFKSLTQNQTMSSSVNTENKTADIGSIFATSKSDEAGLRLAPPPSTATGRGRGRGRGRGAANSKSQSQQPPLLDLL